MLCARPSVLTINLAWCLGNRLAGLIKRMSLKAIFANDIVAKHGDGGRLLLV